MSRRDPCVHIRLGIERAPSVTIDADSDEDFQRLAFAVRSSNELHALVSAAVEAEQRSLATRRVNRDILSSLQRVMNKEARCADA